ncbi:MAG: two-component system response regulator, partial [Cyanobacteria bacterium M5B4]
MRILIVDDDVIIRRVLETTLSMHGYKPLTAINGQQAWELLQQDFVPLILTDWMMPSMDGIELIQRIRAANFPSYSYIVILTSLNTQRDIVHGLEAGADDFLTKPFHEGELLARLNIARR